MNPSEDVLRRNRQEALLIIDNLLAGLEFGSLQFEVKKHKGLVGQIIVLGHRSKKFDTPAEAVDSLAQRMEYLALNRFTGSLSPAVIYKEGEITRVIFDEHHEIDLQKNSTRKQTP